ncbi:putative carbohydrate-binding protein [Paenibacillus agaridevorans]|uniref:Putative carbohydrate-binding protein n=1 Tax=Paenibacillus agaridevorans TaxID=171404 RepID=A0A2R5ETF2_9BACL|nr:discoidin domain-containing protein [Paenibacillus agaridevorans]GBG08959.1 putative carbohydrate-binding protein [Paenibacillus agaridevorans]
MKTKRIFLAYVLVIGLLIQGAVGYLSTPVFANATIDEIFIDPDGSGTLCSIAAPCSLEGGRDKVRTINDDMDSDIIVYLRGGTYVLDETFQLTSEDSGRNGFDVYYKAYPDETPVLSGGISIEDWALYDNTAHIYRAEVSEELETRQLYVNGVRAERARGGELPGAVQTTAGYTTTDLSMAEWRNADDIEFVFRKLWMETRCGVSSISGADITMDEPCYIAATGRGVAVDNPTWIENAYELLDEEGEWYLDRTERYLYYKPRLGEDLSTAQVIAPVLETLVQAEGTLDAPIKNIVFEGLTFSYATWLQPNGPHGYREIQANIMPPLDYRMSFHSYDDRKVPANVTVSGGHQIRFERNTFEHLGAVGLNVDYGAKNNVVRGNIFQDISGNAIMLGDIKEDDYLPRDERRHVDGNEISNNFITQAGVEYHGSVGIWVGYTKNTVVAHNELTDLPYSGISIGWGWGEVDEGGYYNYPTPTIVDGNQIIHNKIWNVMHTVIDGAGIYSLSASPNQLIAGNVIYDVHTHGAIYLDNKSRYNTVLNNVSFDILGSFHLFLNDNRGNSLFSYNFWDETTSLYDNTVYTGNRNARYVGNQFADQVSYLPASLINQAGLEAEYRNLNPLPAKTDQEPPSAPTGLQATVVDDHSVTLQWMPAQDNVKVTGYEIWRDGMVVGITEDTSFRVAHLHPGKTYSLSVRARDAELNVSSSSSPLSVTTKEDTWLDNLALNKKVIVSYLLPEGREADMHAGHAASRAVDGNRVTTAVSMGEFAWQLQVDLESVQSIDRIVVDMHEQLYATEYNVLISDNGIHFSKLIEATNGHGGINEHVLDTAAQARYVRVEAVKPDGPGQPGIQMQIQELEIYNNQSLTNLAYKKPARAFYIGGGTIRPGTNRPAVLHNGHGPEKAIDGDDETTTAATGEFAWQYHLDLGSVQNVDRMVLDMPSTLYATEYDIWVAKEAGSFKKLKSVVGASGGPNEHIFANTIEARYIAIVAIKPDGPSQPGVQMQIQELEVYNNQSLDNLALSGTGAAYYNDSLSFPTYKSFGYEAIVDNNAASIAQAPSLSDWTATVDLGEITAFNQVNVTMPVSAYASEFTIETSTDDESYTSIADVTGFDGGLYVLTSVQNARYVRIVPADGQQMAIAEISIYNSSNRALGQLAGAVAYDDTSADLVMGHEAEKANDGNPYTSARTSETDPWRWSLDLGSVQQLNKLRLLMGHATENAGHQAEATLLTSLDGEIYQVALEETVTSGQWETLRFDDQQARYVQLSLTWSNAGLSSEALSIYEVELYDEREAVLIGTTTDSEDTDRFLYQPVSTKSYILQAGDRIEYEVMLLDAKAGIGGIDLLTTDGKKLKDQIGLLDQWGISASPSSDLSSKGVGVWLKREIVVPPLLMGRTVSQWLLGLEHDQPETTVGAKYKNLNVRDAYGNVALRVDLETDLVIEAEMAQGYEVDRSVRSVRIEPEQLKLVSGDREMLIAHVVPSYATNTGVSWHSSNPLIASVDQQGQVIAKQQGHAVITVTTAEGAYTDSVEIEVSNLMVLSDNYALNKPATAYYIDTNTNQRVISHTHQGHGPNLANDGDDETAAVSNQSFAWSWEVDLGEVVTVNLVKGSMHDINYATAFEIAGSEDGVSYQVLGSVEQFTGGHYAVSFADHDVRYLEVRALKPDGPGQAGNQMHLNEVGVYRETLHDAWVLETQAQFDRNPAMAADIEMVLLLNGHALTGVYNGMFQLTEGQEYSINNNVLLLKKSYLASLNGSEVVFKLEYDAGAASQFTVSFVDTTPSPSPSPAEEPSPTPNLTPSPTPSASPSEVPSATPSPSSNTTPGPKPGLKFVDVPASHWAKSSINRAIELGIVNGYGDGTFRPDSKLSRMEFAAILARALKLEDGPEKLTFGDADSIPAWASPFIRKAVHAGIINGYEDGMLHPQRQVTRAEMAVMMARALKLAPVESSLDFADAEQIPAWARPYVAAVYDAGFIKGRGNRQFAPLVQATRAEVIHLIVTIHDYYEF